MPTVLAEVRIDPVPPIGFSGLLIRLVNPAGDAAACDPMEAQAQVFRLDNLDSSIVNLSVPELRAIEQGCPVLLETYVKALGEAHANATGGDTGDLLAPIENNGANQQPVAKAQPQ